MNFDFSDEQQALKNDVNRVLRERCPLETCRAVLEGDKDYDHALWTEIAALGWPSIALPEEYGGVGLGYLELCVMAEELGRALAPIPFSSSIYLFAEALIRSGNLEQREAWLPRLASGDCIGALAFAEGTGFPRSGSSRVLFKGGKLSGEKWPVADGDVAQGAVVLACDEAGKDHLCLVQLDAPEVARESLPSIDPSRSQARLRFDDTPAQVLTEGDHWGTFQAVLNAAAILFAFEQIGGADRCLDQAVDFAKERMAFGRVIGSFQAIKHNLANMYVNNQIARSNAYYGAWALSTNAPEMALAAAVARVSATEAYEYATRESLHVHGGMGFTWEADCHLFLRRSRSLAVNLGGIGQWKRQITDELEQKL
ncbi:MAG: acyl-CoA dehydrogenase family protein [Pseudomonadales bacterium]